MNSPDTPLPPHQAEALSMNVMLVTPQQLDGLLENLRMTVATPLDSCLDDEELIAYTLDLMPGPTLEKRDQHVAACPACCELLAKLVHVAEQSRAATVFERIVELRRWLHKRPEPKWAKLVDSLSEFLKELSNNGLRGRQVALAGVSFAAREPLLARSSEGLLGVFVRDAEDGSLVVRIGVRAGELEGVPLEVSAGEWRQLVRLGRVGTESGEEVGAVVTLPRSEREQLPDGTELEVRVVAPA